MFKHRDVPHCQQCGSVLELRDGPADSAMTGDRHWRCQGCGTERPLIYLVERALKKLG